MPKNTMEVPRIVGSTIVAVREVTRAEADRMGMTGFDDGNRLALILNTGVMLVPWRDPEGNGLGHLVGTFQGKIFDATADDK